MAARIEPRTLRGFADQLPARAIVRERCIDLAKAVFRSYGFVPIETPALEYADILLGKSDPEAEVQRQIYRFRDQGDRDVALRFDLTVPLARFVAQHANELGMPFKRYQVGPAWRGENTQAGRHREFTQCDVDTVGTTSPVADGEIVAVVCDVMAALGLSRFSVRLNDRRLLTAALGDAAGPGVLRAIDKLAKQGPDAVARELMTVGLSQEQTSVVLDLCTIAGPPDEVLKRFGAEAAPLRAVVAVARASGAPVDRLVVDLSIARGLDYYTGTVFETFLDDLPQIGSVFSGGRYDDLAGLYTTQSLPGVGASLGLTRLLDAWDQLGDLDLGTSTAAPVLVLQFSDGAERAAGLAAMVRGGGVGAEVYPDARKIGDQLRYAEKRGHRVAIICGPAEALSGVVKVKDLTARDEREVAEAEVVDEVRRILGG